LIVNFTNCLDVVVYMNNGNEIQSLLIISCSKELGKSRQLFFIINNVAIITAQ
jgi:hypothetical protein